MRNAGGSCDDSTVSYLFQIEGETVWWPALAVGTAYVGAIQGLALGLRIDSGLDQLGGEMVRIEARQFATFVQELIDRVDSQTASAALHDLMVAVIPPAAVMLERVGRSPRMSAQIWADKLDELRAEMPA